MTSSTSRPAPVKALKAALRNASVTGAVVGKCDGDTVVVVATHRAAAVLAAVRGAGYDVEMLDGSGDEITGAVITEPTS